MHRVVVIDIGGPVEEGLDVRAPLGEGCRLTEPLSVRLQGLPAHEEQVALGGLDTPMDGKREESGGSRDDLSSLDEGDLEVGLGARADSDECMLKDHVGTLAADQVHLRGQEASLGRVTDRGADRVESMKVEIWSDVVCPWCYIGKRNLETALADFAHADEVEIAWRSFELDPTTPKVVELSMDEVLERKYGMTSQQAKEANANMTNLAAKVGLEYHLDRVQIGNTFDAHRLIHLAELSGQGGVMKERLLRAYFTESRAISDHATLVELAGDVGLDIASVEAMLSGDTFADDVRADEAQAVALGSTGVPFFVIDNRIGLPGAQPPDVLLRFLERAWETQGAGGTPLG